MNCERGKGCYGIASCQSYLKLRQRFAGLPGS